MSWQEIIDALQWGILAFLFFRGIKNEIRIDRLEK
jgi:hypothetical protein